MEILVRGTPPSEKIYIADCNKCKTRVKFLRSEAKFTDDQRDGSFLTVVCPVCGENINVSTSKGVTQSDIDAINTKAYYDR